MVSEDTNWGYEFTNLPKYNDDKSAIVYSVQEEEVEGYTASVSGYDITNTLDQVNDVTVSGTKSWVDDNNSNGTRPESITVWLYDDGVRTDRYAVATAESGWSYSFTDLPKYNDDKSAIVYSVQEEPVEGYSVSYADDGYDITNTLEQQYTKISGTKTWNSMIDGEKYPTITINLYRDNIKVDTFQIIDGGEEFSFDNLPVYAVGEIEGYTGSYDGHKFSYTVDEDPVNGYSSLVKGTDIINTANTTSVKVSKKWLDGDGNLLKESEIPDSLKVVLLRNDVEYKNLETTLNAANDWMYTFEDLPTHDENGDIYVYSVREEITKEQSENYTATSGAIVVATPNEDGDYEAILINTKNDEEPVNPQKSHTIITGAYIEGTTTMVKVGGQITYTITYYNHFNMKEDITITDVLPRGLKYVSSDPIATEDGSELTWILNDVEPFTGGEVIVTVEVTDEAIAGNEANPILENTATIKIGDDEQTTNPDEVTIYNPSWTVEKSVSGMTGAEGKAQVGDKLTYTITIANTGNVTITKDVKDTFTVDGEEVTLTLTPAEESQGTYADGQVTLEEGETAVLTATYTVQATDSSLVNAVVVGNEDDPEKPEDDVTTDVEDKPAWTVEKRLTNSGTGENGAFRLGEVAEFDIVIENTGNTVLTDLTVTEDLAGAVFTESEGYTVSEDGTTATVTIEKHQTVTLKATYEIQEKDLGMELKNVVTTKSGDEEVPGETPIPTDDRHPKLSVEKEVTSTPAAEDGKYVLGETITYKVTVTNIGNLTLNDIVISDVLTRPDGTTTVPSGFDVNDARIDSLAPGESAEITYSHVVTEADLGGALTNAATADGQPNIPDPDPTTPDPDPTPDEPGTSTVDTEDPSNCSITVTKQTTDYMGEAIVLNEGASFHVALFSDEAMTQQVGEVQTIAYAGNSSTASVTFDNLKRGTYYVAEVDENGNVISDSGSFDGGVYVPQYADGNQVVITDNGTAATFAFTNAFLVLPSGGGYYWEKTLTITKNVRDVDGDEMNVNETFYAGIFTDESLTTLADNVSQNIVPLRLNGTSSVSVDVGVTVPTDGSEITLYVAEVTSAGVPVENTDGFAYTVEVENGAVTLAEESEDAAVVITNTSTEETQESECETTAEKNDGSSNTTGSSTKSVKTGDETPIMMLVCMLGISAMAIILLVFRRRRGQA